MIIEANRRPHNLKTGVSKPYDLTIQGANARSSWEAIASRRRTAGPVPFFSRVRRRNTPARLHPWDEHLLLSMNVFEEFNQLLLQIKDNQLVQSIAPWDIKLLGRNLLVRERERKILVDVSFEPPHRIIINRGRFLKNGVEILIRPEQVL